MEDGDGEVPLHIPLEERNHQTSSLGFLGQDNGRFPFDPPSGKETTALTCHSLIHRVDMGM